MNQIFYIGVVEDINDPLMVGRVKVRVAGVHTSDKNILPTEDLPWAILNNPVSSASISGIGITPVGIVNGTWCNVIFFDPETKQIPVIMGTISGLPSNITEEYEYIGSSRGYDPETKRGYMDPQGVYPLKDNIDESDVNRLARGDKLDSTVLSQREEDRIKDVEEASSANNKDQENDSNNQRNTKSNNYNVANNISMYSNNDLSGDVQLSPHFTLYDFIKSDTASANKINNYPTSPEIIKNLQSLSINLIEKIVEHYNQVPNINSGYRGPALNALVGGVSTSQHCKGQAADIEIMGLSNKELFQWIGQNLDFDQVILEYATNIEKDPNSGWVHVSYNEGHNRHQILLIGGEQNSNTTGGSGSQEQSKDDKCWYEPKSPYAAKYPYNQVTQTRSGHIVEFDDTPEHERIHERHKSGTYYEIGPDGTKVTKIVKDNYNIILGDSYLLIEGNVKLNIKGDTNILNEGNMQIQNKGDLSLLNEGETQLQINGNCETQIQGDCNTYIEGDYNLGVGGKINITSAGDMGFELGGSLNIENSGTDIKSAGNIDIKGTIINLN